MLPARYLRPGPPSRSRLVVDANETAITTAIHRHQLMHSASNCPTRSSIPVASCLGIFFPEKTFARGSSRLPTPTWTGRSRRAPAGCPSRAASLQLFRSFFEVDYCHENPSRFRVSFSQAAARKKFPVLIQNARDIRFRPWIAGRCEHVR